jgi:limonene-1,2-epoxide hydrolase catalytic subunit
VLGVVVPDLDALGLPGVDAVLARCSARLVNQAQQGEGRSENRHRSYTPSSALLSSLPWVVLTERVDWLGRGNQTAPIPVMGAFEVHDGLIHHWRDYFDQAFATALIRSEAVTSQS